jgi:hypothetical protein
MKFDFKLCAWKHEIHTATSNLIDQLANTSARLSNRTSLEECRASQQKTDHLTDIYSYRFQIASLTSRRPLHVYNSSHSLLTMPSRKQPKICTASNKISRPRGIQLPSLSPSFVR